MKLYLIKRIGDYSYDNYGSAVVAAPSPSAARKIHPTGDDMNWGGGYGSSSWVDSPDKVTATLIGTAANETKPGVILASFNAG